MARLPPSVVDTRSLRERCVDLATKVKGILGLAHIPYKDEDDMASDSDEHLATQQSIKAYADGLNNGAAHQEFAENNHRQDNVTNNVVTHQVVRKGWGFITVSGTPSIIFEAISFGITFDDIPIVVTSCAGYKDGSDPSNAGDSGVGGIDANAWVENITTSGITKLWLSSVSFTNGRRILYTWIAIGTYSSRS